MGKHGSCHPSQSLHDGGKQQLGSVTASVVQDAAQSCPDRSRSLALHHGECGQAVGRMRLTIPVNIITALLLRLSLLLAPSMQPPRASILCAKSPILLPHEQGRVVGQHDAPLVMQDQASLPQAALCYYPLALQSFTWMRHASGV